MLVDSGNLENIETDYDSGYKRINKFKMDPKTQYDQICEDSQAQAEQRLIEHFVRTTSEHSNAHTKLDR